MEKGVNKQANFSTIGAKNYAKEDREQNDFYATNPETINILFKHIKIDRSNVIWEPAAGLGHLSERIRSFGYVTIATELHYRPNAIDNKIEYDIDFLKIKSVEYLNRHIITNPPYKLFIEFVEQSFKLISSGYFICMFVPIRYLSGQRRKMLYEEYPPTDIIILSKRTFCAKNGNFTKNNTSGAMDFCWIVWFKGCKEGAVVKFE